jgi:threonine/homoserine/homoserine lactone efflux protein
MLEGITAGFIFSLTLFPGTVWLAKVGVRGRAAQVIAVALGFWLSHVFWLFVAVPGLMMMYAHLSFMRLGMHLFGVFVLGYMAVKFMRSKRAERIDDAHPLPPLRQLFFSALNRSLAMPLRLPAAMAILLATGVYTNHPPTWATLPSVLAGGLIGVTGWWAQFSLLAILFAKRVPQPITLKSLNKIRPFSAALCLCLAGITLFLGF